MKGQTQRIVVERLEPLKDGTIKLRGRNRRGMRIEFCYERANLLDLEVGDVVRITPTLHEIRRKKVRNR